MAQSSDLERFFGYVRAFELAFVSDRFELLEPWLAEDAVHRVEGGGPFGSGARGRAEVAADLRASTHRVDRRFDCRIPEIVDGPFVGPDGIWMRFGLVYRRAGLPDLHVEGEHVVAYEDAAIRSIDERLAPETDARVAAFLAAHGPKLRPEGSPCATPGERDLRELEAAAGRSLARCYGAAKSRQDIGAALALAGEGFVLETLPFGTRAEGRAEAAAQLALFFHAFPDYAVELEGLATGEGVVACWGRARLSFRGAIPGVEPTGKTADLPVFCLLDVRGGTLARERFFFDRAELCEQIGVRTEALADALAALARSGRS